MRLAPIEKHRLSQNRPIGRCVLRGLKKYNQARLVVDQCKCRISEVTIVFNQQRVNRE